MATTENLSNLVSQRNLGSQRVERSLSDPTSTAVAIQDSDQTTIIAVYPARHYADMARDALSDAGIEAFVAADDVHVPLQLTEGAKLVVLERQAEAALAALNEANLLPDTIAGA